MKRKSYAIALLLVAVVAVTGVARSVFNQQFKTYTVKKGESLYGIALANGWSYDTLVALNPSVAADIQKGQTIWAPADVDSVPIPANPLADLNDTIVHVMAPGQSLYDVANHYNTTVVEILYLNPELVEDSTLQGSVVRLVPNSMMERAISVFDSVPVVRSFSQYKVGKQETWFGIAQSHNLPAELLIEVNGFTPDSAPLKKGQYISIPNVDTIKEHHYKLPDRDPREFTAEGRDEIRRDVLGNPRLRQPIDIAILVNIKENRERDVEFLKGWMIAADQLKAEGKKINLSVVNLDTDSAHTIHGLIEGGTLDNFDVIVYTSDRDRSAELCRYGAEKQIYVVNPFCTAISEDVANNHSVMLMPPAVAFNVEVGRAMYQKYPNRTYVFVGLPENKSTRKIDQSLYLQLDSAAQAASIIVPNVDALKNLTLSNEGEYVIVASSEKTEGAPAFFGAVNELGEKYPDAHIVALGRPAWIVYTNPKQKSAMKGVDIFIPSRFYALEDSENIKAFNADFAKKYGHYPRPKLPKFSLTGYDTGMWLMNQENPITYRLPRTGNAEWLQQDINLIKVPEVGFINTPAYLVFVSKEGNVKRLEIKNVDPEIYQHLIEPLESQETEE